MKRLLPLLLGLFFITGCQYLNRQRKDEHPVARAHDKYLFPSDLKNIMQSGMSEEDSARVLRTYVDRWVRTQLMMHNAELNLSEEEQNLEKQIENYRASLLIYRYKEQLLHQKIDTSISNNEIEQYYQNNPSNFLLSGNLVKVVYVKVPRNAPTLWKLRRWYVSDKEEDVDELEKYCFEYAEEYSNFNGNWIYFDEIVAKTPRDISDPARFLQYNTRFEAQDEKFLYFVSVRDYRLAGTTSPLPMIQEDIRAILLNKRKLTFMNELENNIYRDAQNHNYFEIY